MSRPGFVHGTNGTGTVVRRRRTAGTPDAEGKVTYTNSDLSLAQARVSILTANELATLGALAQNATASVLVVLGTDVVDHDQFVVSGIRTELNGTWEVTAVRDATIHLRCFVRRSNT